MPVIDERSRPVLARGTRLAMDKATGQPVLLFPEGVVHLSPTAHAILSRCDAESSVQAIVAALSQEYEASETELKADVLQCLEELCARKLLILV